MTLTAGTRLGPYEVLSPLGAGGMGEVYRARDAKLERDVAIKVLPAHLTSDPEALARFEREAKAVAALAHPNILSIYDFGTHEGVSYAVMDFSKERRCGASSTPVRFLRSRRWTTRSKSRRGFRLRTARGLSIGT
jgi:serine/threonine protein kinase